MVSLFWILQWKKNLKDSADFWHTKMTLKIRIALCLTLKIKKNQEPRNLLYTPIWSWAQPYSSLNSVKLSWKSEVTLICTKQIILLTFLVRLNLSKILSWKRNMYRVVAMIKEWTCCWMSPVPRSKFAMWHPVSPTTFFRG